MPGDHVGQEPDDERRGTQDEDLQRLDRHEQDVERLRHARREERVLEVAPEAVRLDARTQVHHVRPRGQHDRQADHGGARDVEERDHRGDVHDQDGAEDRRQQLEVLAAVLLAQHLDGDRVAHEVEDHLDRVLEPAGHQPSATGGEAEHQQQDGGHDDADQHDPVELEGRALEEDGRREEVRDRRRFEAAALGGEQQGDRWRRQGILPEVVRSGRSTPGRARHRTWPSWIRGQPTGCSQVLRHPGAVFLARSRGL